MKLYNKHRLILSMCFVILSASALPQKLVHPWKGKKVAFFGDSITDPNVTPLGKDADGKTNMHYWNYLHDWLNITPYVYAISGRQWNDIPRQTEALKKEHADDVDAITIFMGTNDYISDIPLGEWYSVKEDSVLFALGKTQKGNVARLHRTLSKDKNTLRGRINIAMEHLKVTYPEKQIVILTPIHRAYATFGDKNIQPDERYANKLGLFIDDYVKVIREVADVWAVPVIDLFSVSGIYPMLPAHHRFINKVDTDRLHPNTQGHRRIAQTLYYQLSALPATF